MGQGEGPCGRENFARAVMCLKWEDFGCGRKRQRERLRWKPREGGSLAQSHAAP